MSKIEKTEGIVIKCKDLTETSQVVWLFTKDYGKIKIVAKGSRVRNKRFKTKFDLFGQNEIVFYYNPKSELHTLSESEIIEPFTEIRSDINKMAVASYMVELLDNLVGLEDPSPKIYSLVIRSLRWLAETEELSPLKLIYEIKLLQFSGDLEKPENVSKGASAIIKKIIQSKNISSLKKIRISKSQLEELKNAIGLTIDFSLGKRLKSLDFLEEVSKTEGGFSWRNQRKMI